jgi:hypothetical protein
MDRHEKGVRGVRAKRRDLQEIGLDFLEMDMELDQKLSDGESAQDYQFLLAFRAAFRSKTEKLLEVDDRQARCHDEALYGMRATG